MQSKTEPPAPGRYIDLLVDFAFKKVFGSEPNKDLLIDFLNEVFRGRKHIVDLIYNKNEHPGDLKDEGGAIFDLLCTGDKGERFLIEVQRAKQGYFKERALYYTSRLISGEAPKGKESDWAYNIPEVYFIAILENFTLDEGPGDVYLHDVCLWNRETNKIFYDKLGFTYIELSRFVKGEAELQTDLDKWLYVLKNISRMDKLPAFLRKPIFEKLFNIAEYTNLTKKERNMYDSSMKYKWDKKNEIDFAKAEGREEGKYEEACEIAREMKEDGLPTAQIVKFTKLSIEEIEKL